MIRHKEEIVINQPVEQVFTFVANPENFPKWQSDVVTSKVITDGPLKTGSKFTEVVRILGRPVETVCEITEYDYPRKMSFRSDSSSAIRYGGEFHCDPAESGTRVEIQADAILRGAWRVVEPLFSGEVKRALGSELQKLKTVLETQSQPLAS